MNSLSQPGIDRTATIYKANEALQEVMDPCSLALATPMSIVDLGLVRDLAFSGAHLAVTIMLTNPTCWYAPQIEEAIKDALVDLPLVDEVSVVLSDEIWFPEYMKRSNEDRLHPLVRES